MTSPDEQPSVFSQFWAEMRRRHVVRFAVGYAAAAFVLLQLAEIILPAFGREEDWMPILVIAVVLGFPPALLAAWIFDVTPQGIRRTEDLPADQRMGPLVPRLALMVATFAVVGGLALWMAGAMAGGRADGATRSGTSAVELADYDPSRPITSLAVLPLDNITAGGEQDYFSTGMHEELIAQLSQIAGLRVVSRTSVARYAGTTTPMPLIGRELGVDAVIEGSVRRDDERVRITIQLIHAASDTHIWSRQYDRKLDNILALQSEVALEIARAIRREMAEEEQSRLQRTAARNVDPRAADAYLRGKFEADKGTPAGYQAALGYFEQAVQEDSTFAPAVAGVAGTRFLIEMARGAPDPSDVARARSEAVRAIRLDSTSTEAREVFALLHEALPGMDAAVRVGSGAPSARAGTAEVLPGLDSAFVLTVTQLGRRIEEQMRSLEGVGEREGRSALFAAAQRLFRVGQFDEAASLLEDVVEDAPENADAWQLLTRALVADGDPEEAADVVASWSATGAPGAPSTAEARELAGAVDQDGTRGYWAWTLRRLLTATQAGGVRALDLATAHAGLGNREEALSSLRQAFEERDRRLPTLRSDPVWDDLRDDPRFQELVRRLHVSRPPPPPGR